MSAVPDDSYLYAELPETPAEQIGITEVHVHPATDAIDAGWARRVDDFDCAEVDITPWPVDGWRALMPGTGVGGGTIEGDFDIWSEGDYCLSGTAALDVRYVLGWYADPTTARLDTPHPDRSRMLIRYLSAHPDGGQVFFPRTGSAYVALLAAPGHDLKPKDFRGFYCDGSFGLHINAGVWHAAVLPLAQRSTFDNRQGRVHASIGCDTVKEFKTYLSVPLAAPG